MSQTEQQLQPDKRHLLKLEFKDVVQIGIVFSSVLIFYFAQLRDTERRVTILETKIQAIETNIVEMKGDLKAILSSVQGVRR